MQIGFIPFLFSFAIILKKLIGWVGICGGGGKCRESLTTKKLIEWVVMGRRSKSH